jgi:hypothetical protein
MKIQKKCNQYHSPGMDRCKLWEREIKISLSWSISNINFENLSGLSMSWSMPSKLSIRSRSLKLGSCSWGRLFLKNYFKSKSWKNNN